MVDEGESVAEVDNLGPSILNPELTEKFKCKALWGCGHLVLWDTIKLTRLLLVCAPVLLLQSVAGTISQDYIIFSRHGVSNLLEVAF